MGAARTLLRKTLADQARRAKPENTPAKRGTPSRSVSLVSRPTRWFPYEITFHATKGWRRRYRPDLVY